MKAAMHKYRKEVTRDDLSDDNSDDDRPLASSSSPVKLSTQNGTNGDANSVDPMSEDEPPIVPNNRKRQRRQLSPPESQSEDDVPLAASSSPAKPTKVKNEPPATPNGNSTRFTSNGRVTKKVFYREQSSSGSEGPSTSNNKSRRKKAVQSSRVAQSDDDDDVPLAKSSSPVKVNGTAHTKAKVESSDDEKPLATQSSPIKPPPKPRAKPPRKKRKVDATPPESEDETPLNNLPASSRKRPSPPSEAESEDESSSEAPVKAPKKRKAPAEPKPKAKRAPKAKAEDEETKVPATPKKKGKAKEKVKDESPRKKAKTEEEEDIYKWWEKADAATEGVEGDGVAPSHEDVHGDGTKKWNTLRHNGVMFPPPYAPLPKTVKFYYDGEPVDLPPETEEIAYFFAKLLGGPHVTDKKFQGNFFRDFTQALTQHPPTDGTEITEFEKCDFQKIYDYINSEKERKKAMTKDEKKAEKERIEKEEERFKTCLLDGRKEKVGNFRVEPPGLFLGRGDHPKKGSLKLRLSPEDITINVGEGEPIPVPNIPGKWREVIHDNKVTWLANWKENINGNFKYVFLAASSSLKGQSDMMKFEKARELKQHVARIRQDYQAELKARLMADRQRATAMYFIDKLALRAGNEKGDDEADTVGCCSLRCEHVTLEPPNKLHFDFLGKDSIRYYNTVEVDPQIYKNIRIFKDGKEPTDSLFDRVTTSGLNKHLQSYMKGLTAKVFRTYNASITLQEQLDNNTPKDATVMEKLTAYNRANRQVAVLCNHQRSVSKGHGDSMAKMGDRLKGLKYERMKLRHALFKLEPKKKKVAKYAELESDLDDEFIENWEENLKEKELDKVRKKFAKENEKLVADGEEAQEESVLEKKIQDIEEEFERLASERGTEKAELKRAKPAEKIEDSIATMDEKIKNFKLQMVDKEEGKEVSLGTSKINYLDPRITAAWCAEHDVPIGKIFSKTLIQKFPWAMNAPVEWKF